MREVALVVLPLLAAAIAFALRTDRSRPVLLPLTGLVHVFLAIWLMSVPPSTIALKSFGFDPLARVALPMVSILFAVCSFYAVAYLKIRAERANRIFVTCLLLMLGLLSLALQALHLGLLWVAAEAATLIVVPLLHFNGTARAFEGTWKYLLIGGTGIALSLLGSFFLGYASLQGGGDGDLAFATLSARAAALSRPWTAAAWVLLLAGYGTKMGLVPMHTWKPDAYGEAPSLVGALLAGGMTTMAFVAVVRVKQVMDAANLGVMTDRTLIVLGVLSMVVAALYLLGTPDFKRMLAYSSVEHMGILTIGAALGVAGLSAALFHVWNNGLTKGALFLSAGNIRRAAGARTVSEVRGMSWVSPMSARMFVIALLAITACPPFGPFFSELRIVQAAFLRGNWPVAALFLGSLLFAFFGLTRLVFAIVDGRPRLSAERTKHPFLETPGVIIPPLILLGFSLWLGLAAPGVLQNCFTTAARLFLPGQ